MSFIYYPIKFTELNCNCSNIIVFNIIFVYKTKLISNYYPLIFENTGNIYTRFYSINNCIKELKFNKLEA